MSQTRRAQSSQLMPNRMKELPSRLTQQLPRAGERGRDFRRSENRVFKKAPQRTEDPYYCYTEQNPSPVPICYQQVLGSEDLSEDQSRALYVDNRSVPEIHENFTFLVHKRVYDQSGGLFKAVREHLESLPVTERKFTDSKGNRIPIMRRMEFLPETLQG